MPSPLYACVDHGEPRGRAQCLEVAWTGWTERGRRGNPCSVRHGHHRRRSAPDPLAPIDAPTWLVVRDMWGQLLELTELPPQADQRAVLVAARDARIAEGWRVTEIGPQCAHFFATQAGDRVMVGVEREPTRRIRR